MSILPITLGFSPSPTSGGFSSSEINRISTTTEGQVSPMCQQAQPKGALNHCTSFKTRHHIKILFQCPLLSKRCFPVGLPEARVPKIGFRQEPLNAPCLGDKFGESLGGSQAPPSFWKVPGLPRKFAKLPRNFFGDFPRSSLTVELNSNPEVPRKFPRLPRKFPKLPRKFPGLPRRSAPFSGKPDALSWLTKTFSDCLEGLFAREFKRENGPLRHSGNGPLKSENGPLRKGNAPLTLMGRFQAPRHAGKQPL